MQITRYVKSRSRLKSDFPAKMFIIRVYFYLLILFSISTNHVDVCVSDSFSSKVGCEHEKVTFECEPNTRLAIYSASYGRTQYQSVQCPQPQGVAEESE